MSATFVLAPLAIAYGISLCSSAVAVLCATKERAEQRSLEPVETTFNDAALLQKTLSEHGMQIRQNGADDFSVVTEAGTLHYFRASGGGPFLLEATNVGDINGLLQSLSELENEYGRNVQTFTYHKIMEGLAEHGMELQSEELLDDNVLLLTLNV